ncbi:MAG: type II secretion system protein [Candidatus Vogelbacteria bacterium]|nr:type II secretion system protein [Candidatus Vogelbacteria bacterium]
MKRGFTILELLITVVIMALLSSLVLWSGGRLRERAVVKATTQEIASDISKAQSQAQSGLNGNAYGIRVLATSTVLFLGASFSPVNVIKTYVTPANISLSISPTGDLVFSRLTGQLVSATTVVITVTGTATIKQISINPNGAISVQ